MNENSTKKSHYAELRVTEDVKLLFHVIPYERKARLGSVNMTLFSYKFLSRRSGVDNWPVMPPMNYAGDMPTPFHAMLDCASNILPLHYGRNRVYEGDHDMVINFRQLIQNVAQRYNTTPEDMEKFWPQARTWLSYTGFTHPLTLTELTGNLIRQGKAEVKK